MKNAKQGVFILVAVVMIVASVGLIMTKNAYDGGSSSREKNGTRTFSGTVDKLVFEAGACEIDVTVGNTEEFILSYEGLSHATLSDSLKDGTLRITYRQDAGWPAKMFYGNSIKDTKITLTIPEDAVLSEAAFEFGAAEIEMDDITAKELLITVGAGELTAHKLTATEKALFTVGAGAFYAEDVELTNAILECGVGEMELSGNIIGESIVDCGVGETTLTLTGDEEDYQGDLNCGLGEIHMGSVEISGNGNKSYGTSSAECRMDIKCGIGEVDVRFH
ncbi:MAG: DUF4097 family beta strand repeat protein [Lachnospiraceae bacterium]|nr:DUF4097 family beta strand repeat protein [Lachnospiraceae bacterium]